MAKRGATSEVNSEIAILSGEFVESVYDSINTNDGPFLYFPLYGKSKLSPMAVGTTTANQSLGGAAGDHKDGCDAGAVLGGKNSSYRITRYLYCTTKGLAFWPTGTSWMGYIAERSEEAAQKLGRRDIVVAIRGTMGTSQWIQDFKFAWSDFPFVQTPASGTKVHSGFLSIYTSTDGASSSKFGEVSMRDQMFKELRRLLNTKSSLPVSITITGHSLGAALATLAACDVGCNIATDRRVTVSAITFASPRVGNDAFKQNAEIHTAFITRYRSVGDPVPWVPPSIWPYRYVHVGTELILDWTKSPYVSLSISKWSPFSFNCHNLELHLHVLAAEDSGAVHNTMDGLLPTLDAAEARSSIYVMDYLAYQPAWEEDADREVVKEELEQVKQVLQDDQEGLKQFLREVAYIAEVRGDPTVLNASVSRRRPITAGRSRLRSDQESPFDKRHYSLLNKSASILKKEFHVPEAWLVHPNKDMVYYPVTKQWLPRVDRPQDIPEPSNEEYN